VFAGLGRGALSTRGKALGGRVFAGLGRGAYSSGPIRYMRKQQAFN